VILAIDANRSCGFEGGPVELPKLRELILKETCYRACKIVEIPEECEIHMVYRERIKAKISKKIISWKPENEIMAGTGPY